MKLVDILALDLKTWPKGVECLTQSNVDCEIYDALDGKSDNSLRSLEPRFDTTKRHSQERETYPIVTHAQWQAAVDALKADKEKVMVVDWSQAPKEATHCNREGTAFHDFSGGNHRHWLGGQWVTHFYPIEDYDTPGELIARPSEEWTGEWRPPVGAIVFCSSHNQDVEILKHSEFGTTAACQSIDSSELFWGGDFEPIRTPEQIAADERELGINQVMADYEYTVGPCTHKLARSQAERIYDAGYRKWDLP